MKRMLALGIMSLTLTACVNPDDIRTLDDRVYAQKVRIDGIEQKVTDLSTPDPQQADTWSQVQSMRLELASLQGEVESLRRALDEQQAATDANRKSVNALSGDMRDVHSAWQQMTSQLGVDVDLAAMRAERQAAEQAAGAPAANATATDGAAAADAANATAEAPANGDMEPATPAAQPEKPAAPAVAANADPAKALYDSGRKFFEERKYAEGQARWEEFVENFPKHELVANALFWQGECYYQLKDYARAVLKYQEVLDGHKKSPKYPTALLKQGLSFMRLGRVKAGRLLLHDVVEKFPKSPEARRATALLKGQQ
ncbi:tol-pal system protein YbgF [Desulfobaculum xiamenense]|uniref:Tol-pal system protein YbgF n=1 Tax=Desulfobaculum xiamenense TaxID=995050 RepID=A0A846QK57_9BACT|nr:tol-pal system protein YbgF [Desulfobaculum xiamenense]NJB66862.1 tol-pal system protein YbgF [Desulfobaculum xiamenense]